MVDVSESLFHFTPEILMIFVCVKSPMIGLVAPAYLQEEGTSLHLKLCWHGLQYDGRAIGMWVGCNIGGFIERKKFVLKSRERGWLMYVVCRRRDYGDGVLGCRV